MVLMTQGNGYEHLSCHCPKAFTNRTQLNSTVGTDCWTELVYSGNSDDTHIRKKCRPVEVCDL